MDEIDSSIDGIWLFHPEVAAVCEAYRIHFRKGNSSLDNHTLHSSLRLADHSSCEAFGKHRYCRILAKCSDPRQTTRLREEWVPICDVQPQRPKKSSSALIVRGDQGKIGRVVTIKEYKLRGSSLVHNEADDATWREETCNMTLIEKSAESDCNLTPCPPPPTPCPPPLTPCPPVSTEPCT